MACRTVLLATLAISVVGGVALDNAWAVTIDVHWPDKIQCAIDNLASPGDIVQIHEGRYAPSANGEVFPINMRDLVSVVGVDAESCTLDAEGAPCVIACTDIAGPGTDVMGFTMMGVVCDASEGGAVYCNNSSPTISWNRIQGTRGQNAVGVGCYGNSSPRITANVIRWNGEKHSFGAHGAGVQCSQSGAVITNNLIIENGATYGGGGGIMCDDCPDFYPIIVNNTIVGSYGEFSGGVRCSNSSPTIVNNIVVKSSSVGGGGITCYGESNPIIEHNDVWGNSPVDYRNCTPGTGCKSLDPLFVDAVGLDFHLQSTSSCMDAGDNDAPDVPEFDFDYNPRITDGDGDGNCVIDMGAFEYQVYAAVKGAGSIPGYPPYPSSKRRFGFNVTYSGEITGHLQFHDHGTKMKVRSETIRTLVVFGETVAELSGECSIDGVSGYDFLCRVEDNGKPGKGTDRFSIDISGPGFSYSASDLLMVGNITIEMLGDGPQSAPTRPWQGATFSLLQNSPNPLRNETTIRFSIPEMRHVTLAIYDLSGRTVEVLVDEELRPGVHTVNWGPNVPAGTYFYGLRTGELRDMKKMILLH